jgi:hypothetical protein
MNTRAFFLILIGLMLLPVRLHGQAVRQAAGPEQCAVKDGSCLRLGKKYLNDCTRQVSSLEKWAAVLADSRSELERGLQGNILLYELETVYDNYLASQRGFSTTLSRLDDVSNKLAGLLYEGRIGERFTPQEWSRLRQEAMMIGSRKIEAVYSAGSVNDQDALTRRAQAFLGMMGSKLVSNEERAKKALPK